MYKMTSIGASVAQWKRISAATWAFRDYTHGVLKFSGAQFVDFITNHKLSIIPVSAPHEKSYCVVEPAHSCKLGVVSQKPTQQIKHSTLK